MSPDVYQLKVVLRRVSPMVWRRLLLRSDQSIADLHYAIQIAMDWSDSYLNLFHIHGKDYGVYHEGGLCFDDNPGRVRLADFGFRLRERFLYEYNFYAHWEHDVRLEKILPWNPRTVFPVCIGGSRRAPPEDCGGAHAYMENGDPRWSKWLNAVPGKDYQLLAGIMQRVLDSGGDCSVIPDRKVLLAAMKRIQEHREARPDRIDRHGINRRLRQYAEGDRDWLFCETITIG